MSEPTLEHYTEFETKYRVGPEDLMRFRAAIEAVGPLTLYCEGTDEYYTLPGTGRFKRFRYATYPAGCRKEVTTKVKPDGAKSNIRRIEKNLDVTGNSDDLIRQSILDDGYVFDFSITKYCHIYAYEDATVVFYTVVDTTPGRKRTEDHFVEIEVREDTIHRLTEAEARAVIAKYERALAPMGITPKMRVRRSLYDMYTGSGK